MSQKKNVCVWGGGGVGVRACVRACVCVCVCMCVCVCVYSIIVKNFLAIERFLAPCFIELLMFYC